MDLGYNLSKTHQYRRIPIDLRINSKFSTKLTRERRSLLSDSELSDTKELILRGLCRYLRLIPPHFPLFLSPSLPPSSLYHYIYIYIYIHRSRMKGLNELYRRELNNTTREERGFPGVIECATREI